MNFASGNWILPFFRFYKKEFERSKYGALQQKKIKFGIGAVPERSQSPSQLSHFMNKIIDLGKSQHIIKSVQLPRNEPIVGGGKQ